MYFSASFIKSEVLLKFNSEIDSQTVFSLLMHVN